MKAKYNPELKETARMLRKNMTPEEKRLWHDFLKLYPVRFQRQKIMGNYIVDFYCTKAKLVIELDGRQHYTEKGKRYDEVRTEFLEEYGLTVLRIPNSRINKDFNFICRYIDNTVKNLFTE